MEDLVYIFLNVTMTLIIPVKNLQVIRQISSALSIKARLKRTQYQKCPWRTNCKINNKMIAPTIDITNPAG